MFMDIDYLYIPLSFDVKSLHTPQCELVFHSDRKLLHILLHIHLHEFVGIESCTIETSSSNKCNKYCLLGHILYTHDNMYSLPFIKYQASICSYTG